MIYSPDAVATIVNLVIASHVGTIEVFDYITPEIGFDILFKVTGGKLIDAMNAIRSASGCGLKPALASLRAVQAYTGVALVTRS